MKTKYELKTAIVHDWLSVFAGAERVLEQIICLFPDADIGSRFRCPGPAGAICDVPGPAFIATTVAPPVRHLAGRRSAAGL